MRSPQETQGKGPVEKHDRAQSRAETLQILKKNYPIFLAEAFISFSVAGIMLTMVITSQIIFPNEPFRPFETGLIISARTWTVALAGVLFGIIADRSPRKPLFIIILVIAGIGRLLNGFAPYGAGNENGTYLFFIFCNIVVGIGQGGLMPASISYADDAVDLNLRSHFFGLYEIFRQIFQILGLIFCAVLFQIGLWREYFWLTGIMMFACACMVIFVIKEPKRGSKQKALECVLSDDSVQYRYKLNKETMHTILFSRTNMIIIIEGIFTWIIFSIALFLMYPYLQSPPYNISAVVTALLMVIFGLPGAIFGALTFSRLSDRLAAKDIKYRIDLIIFSIVALFFVIIVIFIVPFPHLTPAQGNDIFYLMAIRGFILIGFALFFVRALLGLYHINQSPIIQTINLPESQGTVSAWNQFLETIGMGLGPFIAGLLLVIYNQDYLLTAVISLSIGMPSAFLWLLARRWIHKDIGTINNLLEGRAVELKNQNKAKKN